MSESTVRDLYNAAVAALDWFETNGARLPTNVDVAPMEALQAAIAQADAER